MHSGSSQSEEAWRSSAPAWAARNDAAFLCPKTCIAQRPTSRPMMHSLARANARRHLELLDSDPCRVRQTRDASACVITASQIIIRQCQ